jgi:peptidoglycan/LPS O-acetylase OafA/YrhL
MPWQPAKFGFLGVDVFFVLSGYLITQILLRSVAEKGNLRKFYQRRLARLAPGLFAMVLVIWILSFTGVWSLAPWAVPVALFYVMNLACLFVPSDEIATPLTPSWSLASEEQFYLVWPIALFSALKRFSQRTIANGCLILSALIFVAQHAPGLHFSSSVMLHGPFFRPAGLLMGSAVALYKPAKTATVPILLGLAGALFGIAVISANGLYVSAGTALVLLVLGTPTRMSSLIGKALSLAPLAAVGRRSYSIYLWNLPVILLIAHFLPASLLADLLALLMVFAVSEISYRVIEIPSLRKLSPK